MNTHTSPRPIPFLTLAFSALLFGSTAAAQDAPPSTMASAAPAVTGGIKIGMSYSTQDLEDRAGEEPLAIKRVLDLWGGLFVRRNVSERFGVQAEALIGQRGAEDDDNPPDGRFRLLYLDVPVTARVGTTTAAGTSFYAFTGPQFSLRLKAEELAYEGGTRSITDEIRSWDFGWTIGVGADVRRFSVDARYTHGILDINKTPGGSVRNSAFNVLFGVALF